MAPSSALQFIALLRKNLLLQTRSRKTFLGIGGWGALVLQVLLPAAFFLLMCIPKYYIHPISHRQQLTALAPDIDSRWWSGPNPYSGPALQTNVTYPAAHLVLVPDTPAVQAFAQVFARALACPPVASKRVCPPNLPPSSFHCLFLPPDLPEQCQDPDTCKSDVQCWGHLLSQTSTPTLTFAPNEQSAVDEALKRPPFIDAVVVFETDYQSVSGANNNQDDGPELSHQLVKYSIRMNHTDLPPTRFILDTFDVFPTRNNGLSYYQQYWFFANLQHIINRAVVGMRAAELRSKLPVPSPSPPPPNTPPTIPPPNLPPAPTDSPPVLDSIPLFVASNQPTDRAAMGLGNHMVQNNQQASGKLTGLQLPAGLYDEAAPAPLHLAIKPFPWPAVQQDLGAASAAVFFNLLLVYAFLSPARGVVGGIVREKELKLREGMKLMGLSDTAYWGSWFLTHWSSLLVSGLLCALVGLYTFQHTKLSLMMTFFALFTAALVSFSYCLSTLFSASRVAGAGAQLLYALAMLPGFLAPSMAPYAGTSWYLCCLLPPGAASLWAACLINWELISQGLTWTTATLPVVQGSSFCAASVLWILALDIVLYTGLAWYLDKVLPTSPSKREHPLFFLRYFNLFQPCVSSSAATPTSSTVWASPGPDSRTSPATSVQPVQEIRRSEQFTTLDIGTPEPSVGRGTRAVARAQDMGDGAAAVGIHVRGLRKVFHSAPGRRVQALDDASLDVRPASITALLGHNGAGKTTLISVLTGLEAADSGRAWINSMDTATHMHLIRQDLGVCPQFDVLWPELSVTEHLQLHAALKGYTGLAASLVVDQAISAVGLSGSENQLAGDLSGGQRRKLSLASALVGNPSVVLVDEPTSGMDPHTRRFTWELLRKQRFEGGSAVLLTTHSMEEAEALADDVVIMAHGRVVAQGTPDQLKARYGEGYTLTLVTPGPSTSQQAGMASSQASVQDGPRQQTDPHLQSDGQQSGYDSSQTEGQKAADAALLQLMSQYVPDVVSLGRQGAQIAFRLPRESTPSFPALLRRLDEIVAETDSRLSRVGSSHSTRQSSSGVDHINKRSDGLEQGASKSGTVGAMAANISNQLCVTSYGISVTTLEEVFIRVTEGVQTAIDADSLASRNGQQPHVSATDGTKTKAWFPEQYGRGNSSDIAVTLPPGRENYQKVSGSRLVWQQLGALITKRALCAQRERLTLLTQLLAPLALVVLSLWVSGLSLRSPDEKPLLCNRETVLMGAATPIGATQDVRSNASWTQWLNSYAQVGKPMDSNTTQLWKSGPVKPDMMEGYLLNAWYSGTASYDGLFMQQLPPALDFIQGSTIQATVLLNQTAIHGITSSISQVANAALTYLEQQVGASSRPLADGPPGGTSRFQVINHPLPTLAIEPVVRVRQDATGLFLVVCLTLASALMSASVAVHLVRERACKAKHTQMVSGAQPALFWAANAIWDYLQISVTSLGIIALIALYHLPQYSGVRLLAVSSLLLCFGAAGISLTYLLQGLFNDEMLALQRLNTAYFLVGYLGFVATWIIDLILIFTQPQRLKTANVWVKHIFRLVSPHYCFSKGVYDISQTYKSDIPLPIKRETNPFAWSVWGSPMTHMAGQAVVYFTLTILAEAGVLRKLHYILRDVNGRAARVWHRRVRSRTAAETVEDEQLSVALLEQRTSHGSVDNNGMQQQLPGRHSLSSTVSRVAREQEDEDVAKERQAVQLGAKTYNSQVLVNGVKKTYHSGPLAALRGAADPHAVHAVRGLWLGIPRGECFGLLGVNGAGKTTTFSMLTGEIQPDEGDAFICGNSVTRRLSAARHLLGYCPQFESLLGAMTPKEVLTLYARLRGVPPQAVTSLVRELVYRLGLSHAMHQPCGTLSGGNKRKLALGVALVGEPPAILLDEPSTGVDPGARRTLWTLLKEEVKSEGHSVVLTSHSMEECEALCDRLCIMVAGKVACLGSCQHLKTRFGGGYILHVSLAPNCTVEQLVVGLQQPCQGAEVAEVHGANVTIHIPRESAHLADLFAWLEGHKQPASTEAQDVASYQGSGSQNSNVPAEIATMQLTSYSLHQATLESVFLRMTQEGTSAESKSAQ